MRILRVTQNLYPGQKGGGSYHIHAMSRDQAAMGHEVTVLTTRDEAAQPRTEHRDGYRVVRLAPWTTVLGNQITPSIVRYLRDNGTRFDVVHAHSHMYFSTNLAALLCRLGETPLAITNHGLYSQTAPNWAIAAYLRTLGRWTFDQADVVFCYTDTDRSRVRELGVTSDIEVVRNGVNVDRFTPDGPSSDRIDHEGTTVLFVGRLVPGKRPLDAVQAVSRLPDELDAKLYVVGDGPLRSEVAERADGSPVELLGYVPYGEMPEIYRASDLLLMTSRVEGLPRAVLEAFATATPVATRDLPQIRNTVERGGEAVPPGEYGSAIQRVLAEADRLGADGREAAKNDFRWQETVAETTDVLTRLA
jgi:glycosyltransferase involved in cell wall biosynthesis